MVAQVVMAATAVTVITVAIGPLPPLLRRLTGAVAVLGSAAQSRAGPHRLPGSGTRLKK